MATPMMYPPTRFAVSVPGGMVGNRALKDTPSHHRSSEPRLPPTEIATIGFHIDIICPLNLPKEGNYAFTGSAGRNGYRGDGGDGGLLAGFAACRGHGGSGQ